MSRPSSIEWFGLAYGGAGAIIIALNLGLVIYGFGLFLISSLLWSVIGWLQREMSLHRFAIGVSLVLSDQGSRVCGVVGRGRYDHGNRSFSTQSRHHFR